MGIEPERDLIYKRVLGMKGYEDSGINLLI